MDRQEALNKCATFSTEQEYHALMLEIHQTGKDRKNRVLPETSALLDEVDEIRCRVLRNGEQKASEENR